MGKPDFVFCANGKYLAIHINHFGSSDFVQNFEEKEKNAKLNNPTPGANFRNQSICKRCGKFL